MKAIIVPIKNPAKAKQRLAVLLAPEQRQKLAAVMFADVARALRGVQGVDRIFVVTNHRPAAEQAGLFGFDQLFEEAQLSESASVDWASRELEALGYDMVMRLPADVPLVTADDIDMLLSIGLGRPGTLMVPSRQGTGTNSILRSPPTLFPSHFGPDSLRLHIEEASSVGVDAVIMNSARIGLDVDEPADIVALLQRGRGTETFRFLTESGIARKVLPAAGSST